MGIQDEKHLAHMSALNDPLIHELALPAAAMLGFPVLSSRYARAYIDLNRDVEELDPLLIEGVGSKIIPGSCVAAGLGLIPRANRGQNRAASA